MVSCQANSSITTLCCTPCGNLNYQAYAHTSVHLISILLFELIIEWSFTKVVICMDQHSKMSIPIVTPFGSVIFLKWFELQQICRKTQDFSFSMEKNAYKSGFILLVYICIIVGDPLTNLSCPIFACVPSHDLDFQCCMLCFLLFLMVWSERSFILLILVELLNITVNYLFIYPTYIFFYHFWHWFLLAPIDLFYFVNHKS